MTPPLAGRRIVLGVSGSIAAYKAAELCRRLTDAGAYVAPVMTADATRFVGEVTLSALASERVRTSLWDEAEPTPHIHLAGSADVILVAPATARLLAAYAVGLADDLLTATLLAARCPVMVCPAMHTEMWEHDATVDNMALLRRRGVSVVEPGVGALAGGDVGVGRMAEPAEIVEAVVRLLGTETSGDAVAPAHAAPGSAAEAIEAATGVRRAQGDAVASALAAPGSGVDAVERVSGVPGEQAGAVASALAAPGHASTVTEAPAVEQDLVGVRVLITAGGTREPLDAVRFLGNRSSGKQGHALAAEAAARGATVTLLTAADLPVAAGIERVAVETAADMERETMTRANLSDVVIMAAAVADFRPKAPSPDKLKKAEGVPEIVLEPTPDILAAVGRNRRADQVLVGFAAETVGGTELREEARRKLTEKKLDLVVANDVSAPSAGFGHDTNEVVLVAADGSEQTVALTDKREVAARVLDVVVALVRKRKS